ncbi:MAG: DNA mismatch repair endonuclease MutL [Candidatus Zixiibacteriota bacterium]
MTMTDTLDRTIAVLPDHLVDQIAAGEVIERPASVVKELIENALDAGATAIDIEIAGAGEKQMRVVDNGVGMSAVDLAQAVLRHATSKIQTVEDLEGIVTFGFRGEALAAVASVSHLEIVSRPRDHDEAAMMFWEGGTRSDSGSVGAPPGTAVTVRHLFYNTPARHQYMRAPSTETRRIVETVTDFAAYHHRVAFSLLIDERQVLHLAAAPDRRIRLIDLYGHGVGDALLTFQGGDAELGVEGHAGKPELARATRDRILTYVNGRRVWSQSLQHAVTAAYGETIPRGRYPIAVVCLNVNPRRVDVNVHPTKREVRFAHERMVYDLTYYSINKVIFASPRVAPVLPLKESYAPQSERLPLPASSPENVGAYGHTPLPSNQSSDVGAVREPPDWPGWPTDRPAPMAATCVPQATDGVTNFWQFNDVYIATVVGEELWIIDQHTAHERVLYEEMLRRGRGRAESQRLLFPESIDLETRELEVFGASLDAFTALGFEVRPFGTRTVLLEGIPTGLKVGNPVILFRRVLEDLEIARRGGEDLMKAAAASTACRAAVMAGDRLRPEEMHGLFARLMQTENPFSCPHGRPTMVKIPITDFDKKFCRA